MLKIKDCRKFMKVCKDCGQLKLMIEFPKDKKTYDGYRNSCKKCRNSKRYKIPKTCIYCGKEFLADRKSRQYCSNSCKSKHQNELNPQNKEQIEVTCERCGKKFFVIKSRYDKSSKFYCSFECTKNRVKTNCTQCGKEINVKKSEYDKHKNHFCNRECMGKYSSINITKENNPNFNSKKVTCEICGKEIYKQPCHINRCEHIYCSKECSSKGFSLYYSGENNACYNPDLTQEDRERNRDGIHKWRKNVFERDNYTCQLSGQVGGKLNAHHLNAYNSDKEHRYDIDNGIRITEELHKLFHNIYGKGNNTKEQFEEFKERYKNKEFKGVA